MSKILFIFLVLISVTVNAQVTDRISYGLVKGIVIDEKSNDTLPYVSVVLFKAKDTTIINGMLTDEKGEFHFDNVEQGSYLIRLSYVGYTRKWSRPFSIGFGRPVTDLGALKFQKHLRMLETVEIVGEKLAVENTIDRMVINVAQNPALTGGSAADVLQTVPSVTVDMDGKVAVRGSGNVTLLIDGRPSNNITLDQLSAANIDKIEVITNPNAKYDPEGTAGIINVVMKQKSANGLNGLIAFNIGTLDKYNGTLTLNYRKKKLSAYINVDGRIIHMRGFTDIQRTTHLGDSTLVQLQNKHSRFSGQFSTARAGADYAFDKKNTLSFATSFGIHNHGFKEDAFNTSTNENYVVSDLFNRNTNRDSKSNSGDFTVGYKKRFDKKVREFDAQVYLSERIMDELVEYSDQDYKTTSEAASTLPALQNNTTNGINQYMAANIDYTDSIGRFAKLETGYKGTASKNDATFVMSDFDNSTSAWNINNIASNQFVYIENIHAGYGILSSNVKKLNYQLGLRCENAGSHGKMVDEGNYFSKNKLSIFPSGYVLYPLDSLNSIKANYTRRINRPSIMALNPFINYSDPKNLSAGNLDLNPEYIDSYELAHLFKYKAHSVVTSLFYKQVNDVITGVVTLDSNGNTFTTYKNQNTAGTAGVELSVSTVIYHFWRLSATGSGFYIKVKGPQVQTEYDHAYSWQLKVNSAMRLPKIGDLQIMFNYTAPTVSLQSGGGGPSSRFMMGGGVGKQARNSFMDIGYKRELMKGKFALLIRIQDIFKTQQFDITTTGPNFEYHLTRTRKSRVLFVGFQYRINDYKRAKDSKPEGSGMEEM